MPDESARRGAVVTLQILLAMMFLAIIGGTAGYLLGMRQKDQVRAGGTGGASPTATGTPTKVTATGRRCLAITEGMAHRPLYQVLYLHTKLSEVWICQDNDGGLYYQGHRGPPGENLVEGTNALYLTGVTQDGDQYVAANTSPGGAITTYYVNRDRLIIRHSGATAPTPDQTEVAVTG